jgi:RNA polymerase sigma-70 factor (ECF subfamily)
MNGKTSDDTELLARIAQGDRLAMREFYDGMAPIAQRFAMRYLSDAVEVADVVQNVMLDVWQTADRFDNRSSVRSWVLAITRNKSVDLIRKTSRTVLAEPDEYIPDDSPTPEAILAAAQESEKIRSCISALSESHRAAIHLAFFEDLTYREVASIENVSENTIKTRIYHAKKLLLRCVTTT